MGLREGAEEPVGRAALERRRGRGERPKPMRDDQNAAGSRLRSAERVRIGKISFAQGRSTLAGGGFYGKSNSGSRSLSWWKKRGPKNQVTLPMGRAAIGQKLLPEISMKSTYLSMYRRRGEFFDAGRRPYSAEWEW